ncbi:flagellar hook-length control protein FliK [uncultured Castellaniella sp.]|uniref:flagellar hook-length control protein FliK n=1 Tax=uncultured Castellaniella sp. TaxID=647907 RepID=UPI002601930D|nr:flagellar hook-length control protein FliK [uncultured Castellaniella sp.]
MPVLPAAHASQPPADTPARAADAGAARDTPAFSNVLSSQRGAAAGDKAAAAPSTGRADPARANAGKKQDPLGPDETLALILDSTALPLMQPAIQTPAALRHQTGAARHGVDAAAGAAASSKRVSDAAPLPTRADAPADPAADAAPASRSARANLGQAISAAGAQTRPQAAESEAPSAHRPAGSRAGALPPAAADGKTPAATPLAAALGAAVRPQAAPVSAAQDMSAAAQAAPLGATLLPAASGPAAQAPVQLAVPTPLGSPQWPQDFSRQVLSLTQSGAAAGHTVTMHVNPPELGPIHITLHLGDALAQASFVSPHANVRQALENALPHLEQQLAQAGLSLGQANVSDQQPGQQQFGQAPQGSASPDGSAFSLDGGATVANSAAASASTPRPVSRPDALVDTFV